MKVSELITKLATIIETDGDLEVLTRSGEMGDPDPVTEANVVNVDRTVYGDTDAGRAWHHAFYRIPYDQDEVTNARAVEIL